MTDTGGAFLTRKEVAEVLTAMGIPTSLPQAGRMLSATTGVLPAFTFRGKRVIQESVLREYIAKLQEDAIREKEGSGEAQPAAE